MSSNFEIVTVAMRRRTRDWRHCCNLEETVKLSMARCRNYMPYTLPTDRAVGLKFRRDVLGLTWYRDGASKTTAEIAWQQRQGKRSARVCEG